jgi:hypothetical protein
MAATLKKGLGMPTAPHKSIQDSPPETLIVLFKIISRRSWDELHRWHEALPGSRVEHVLYGIYVLIIPQGSARELAQ